VNAEADIDSSGFLLWGYLNLFPVLIVMPWSHGHVNLYSQIGQRLQDCFV
jgi:hypothetical protein